jgi:uncharacterized repeat protein (TIGR03803 family)
MLKPLLALFALGTLASAQTATFSTLYTFPGGTKGANPVGQIFQTSTGLLYGVTLHGGGSNNGTAFELDTKSGAYGNVFQFGVKSDGPALSPQGGVVVDSSGNIYGASLGGYGYGTIYKLYFIADGAKVNETIIHTFVGSDGASPNGSLAFDSSGNLYGVAESGGNAKETCPNGCGVVFEVNPTTQAYTVLYAFGSQPNDGVSPEGGITFDASGNIYGVTSSGGAYGAGTLYEISDGVESVLYSFTGGDDGGQPESRPIIDPATGTLYGGTYLDGAYQTGVLYSYSMANGYSTLYSFPNFEQDGAFPNSRLVIDPTNSYLYGVTYGGGSFFCGGDGCGLVYRYTIATGTYEVVYPFGAKDNLTSGSNPESLIGRLEPNGSYSLIGNANGGGGPGCQTTNGCGTVFRLNLAQ